MERRTFHENVFIILVTLLPSTLFLPRKYSGIVMLLLCINWLLEGNLFEKWHYVKRNNFWILMMSFFGIYAVGIFYSEEFRYGFKYMERLLSLVIFPTVFLSTGYKFSQKHINNIFFTLIISTIVVASICLINGLIKNFETRDVINIHTYWLLSHHKLTRVVDLHPVYFSTYLTLCLFFLFHFVAQNFKKLNISVLILFGILILFLVGFNVLLGARTTLIAMTLILTFGSLLYFTFKGKFVMGVITFVVALVLSIAFIASSKTTTARFVDLFRFGKDVTETRFGGYQLRLMKWQSSLEVIKENWLFGVGTGDQKKELDKVYIKRNFTEGYENHYNAHNQYLQTTLALGIVGLFILTLNFAFPFMLAFKARQFVYLSFIVLIALGCLSESMLNVYRGVVFFAFFNTLFYKFTIDNWARQNGFTYPGLL